MRAPVAIAVTLLTGVALSACGATVSTSRFSGESRSVAQTLSDFQSDATARDNTKICNNDLSSAVVSRLTAGRGSCPSIIGRQLDQVDNFDLSASSITVNGAQATARVKTSSGGKSHFDTLTLVKEGSRWKIASLAA